MGDKNGGMSGANPLELDICLKVISQIMDLLGGYVYIYIFIIMYIYIYISLEILA